MQWNLTSEKKERNIFFLFCCWNLECCVILTNTIHVKQIPPYINWGLLEHTNLIHLHNATNSDIVYLSKHDDYTTDTKCCVNSKRYKPLNSNGNNVDFQYVQESRLCTCCEESKRHGHCTRMAIDCDILGANHGCSVVHVDEDGVSTMAFHEVTRKEKKQIIQRQRVLLIIFHFSFRC